LTVYDKSVLATLMGVMQHDIKGITEERFLRLWWMYTFCCSNIFLERYHLGYAIITIFWGVSEEMLVNGCMLKSCK